MRGHALVAALVTALLVAQIGATPRRALAQIGATPRIGPSSPSSRALDQLNNSVTRPMPAVPPPTGGYSSDIWVPDRIVPAPDQAGGILVPGHWERRISDREHYVPPLTVRTPDGRVRTLPGGYMPPPEQRQSP